MPSGKLTVHFTPAEITRLLRENPFGQPAVIITGDKGLEYESEAAYRAALNRQLQKLDARTIRSITITATLDSLPSEA